MEYLSSMFRSVLSRLGVVRLSEGDGSMPGKPTILEVANYFLTQVEPGSGSVMTPLKLQKLCYYAQAWHLALYGKEFFDASFRAWPHGPANLDLYNRYKRYKWNPIGLDRVPAPRNLSKRQTDLLDEIWSVYGRYDAKYLERLTHQEMPWKEARGGREPGDHCDNVISVETMRKFYSEMLHDDEEKH